MADNRLKTNPLICALLASVIAAALPPAAASAADAPFTDVPASEWYYNDVMIAYESGLINGSTATTFSPDDNLTYAEAVKLAACMHQLHTAGSVTLTNSSPQWYQSYVDYSKENRIISKDYRWGSQATRAGYMEIFAGALPNDALAAVNTVADGSIPDVPTTHASAEAIYKLYRAGIVQGVDETRSCNPSSNIKRSEVAAILTRMTDSGKRVNFTLLKLFLPLEGRWICEYNGDPDIDVFFDFYENTDLVYRLGKQLSQFDLEDYCRYEGGFELITFDGDPRGYPAGTIIFYLHLEDCDADFWGADEPEEFITGAYSIEQDDFDLMKLQYIDGDRLGDASPSLSFFLISG